MEYPTVIRHVWRISFFYNYIFNSYELFFLLFFLGYTLSSPFSPPRLATDLFHVVDAFE